MNWRDLFSNTAAFLNSINLNNYYRTVRGQIHTNLTSEHLIIAIWNNRIQNGHCITRKMHSTNGLLFWNRFHWFYFIWHTLNCAQLKISPKWPKDKSGTFFQVALTILINRRFTHFCFKEKRGAITLTWVIKNTTQQPMPTLQWTCTWSWVQCLNYLAIGFPILHSVCNTIILKKSGTNVLFWNCVFVPDCSYILQRLPCKVTT